MNKEQPTSRLVKCPNCKQQTRYDQSNEFRPFCSKRCQTADISSWASETFRIAGEPVDPNAALLGEDEES